MTVFHFSLSALISLLRCCLIISVSYSSDASSQALAPDVQLPARRQYFVFIVFPNSTPNEYSLDLGPDLDRFGVNIHKRTTQPNQNESEVSMNHSVHPCPSCLCRHYSNLPTYSVVQKTTVPLKTIQRSSSFSFLRLPILAHRQQLHSLFKLRPGRLGLSSFLHLLLHRLDT